MKKVMVGLLQMHSGTNVQENLKKATARIEKLAKRGAQIICLPELFASEYFCQKRNDRFFGYAERVPGPLTEHLGKVAKENRVVITTSVYEKFGSKYFNTAVTFDTNGKLLGKYRKMHVPNDPKYHYDEAHYFSQGDLGFQSFKTKFGTIGTMICWDQWFPEGARATALKGAQIIFYPTAIGWQLKARPGINEAEREAWQIIQRSHSIANNVFVVAVNRVGLDQKLKFWGTSFVSDPYGRIIAQAPNNKESDIIAECDLSLIPQMRSDWPFLDARRLKIEKCKL